MSFQTFVTERLGDITARLNAIGTNAKKIDELPVQSTLDPASKIHVSKGGTSESLEVQKIIDSIVNKTYSQLLGVGEITVSGLNVIVPSGAMWVYEGIIYQTTAITTIPETLCAAGYLRKDILVANQSNQIILVKGAESETIRIKPNIPIGTVFVTEIDVDDAVIGTPATPIIGNSYISKSSQGSLRNYDDLVINLGEETRLILHTCTEINYINHLVPAQAYDGKQLFITNLNEDESDIVIHNLFDHKGNFYFPNSVDFTLKFKETIEFKLFYDFGNKVTYLYVGVINDIPVIGISDVTGLPEALDLKLDASAYNQHFKSVYLTEAALIAAHPTGVAGDYAQVNEVGSTDVVNYSWDAEENIWVNNGTGGSGAVNTDALPEGSANLYFTTARVLATLLTGISFVTGGAIVSTDSVLVAFGKIQKQITDTLTAIGLKQDILIIPSEVSASFSLTDAYAGKIIIVTSSCTITIPNGLVAGFNASFVTLAGVTLTIALGGSVVLHNNIGTTMLEKSSFTLQARTTTNNYITAGAL